MSTSHPDLLGQQASSRNGWVWLPYLLLVAGRFLLYFLFGQDAGYITGFFIQLVFSVFLFQILACCLQPIYAALSALSLESLLIQASQIKISQTGEPVTARDVLEFSHAPQLTAYAPVSLYITLVILCLVLFFGFRLRERGWKPFLGRLPLVVPAGALVWVYMFSGGAIAKDARDVLCKMQVCYYSWNPVANARINGSLAHLLMTSEAVHTPVHAPHPFYNQQSPALLSASDPDVVMILCESCFTTWDDRFKTSMMHLTDEGLIPFHLLSPVYGGNTAEAEFEVLTGLSSAVFPGIEYQNYFDRFRSDSNTLIINFNRAGYATASLHNYKARFWQRETVYQKFGFKDSLFIEDMGFNGGFLFDMHPSDEVLYKYALDYYKNQNTGQPSFLYLITMHTHGDYAEHNGDSGKQDYLTRLASSMGDMISFLREIKSIAQTRNRPLALIVYGDHKPALTNIFYKNGVLPQDLFAESVEDAKIHEFVLQPAYPLWKARAQVSAFIQLPNPADTNALANRLNDKPMFCLPAELSALVHGEDDVFWAAVNAICRQSDVQFTKENGNPWIRFFPEGIYAERLF